MKKLLMGTLAAVGLCGKASAQQATNQEPSAVSVSQSGEKNTVSISQSGGFERGKQKSGGFERGKRNRKTVIKTGTNVVTLHLPDSLNYELKGLQVSQSGNKNAVTIKQTGNGNQVTVSQTGSSNAVTIKQN